MTSPTDSMAGSANQTTNQTTNQAAEPRTTRRRGGRLAAVGATFGGVVMLLVGAMQAIVGVSAILRQSFFVTVQDNPVEVSLTGWGWLHLIVGLLVVLTGIGVLIGWTWSFVVGMFLAGMSAIQNFLFLPHYPVWAVVVIALDVLVLWALAMRVPRVSYQD